MYLIPDKFTDLNSCTLNIGAKILKILVENQKNKIKYSKLYEELEKEYKDDTGYILPPALNFLFILGKVRYKTKGDFVELMNNEVK